MGIFFGFAWFTCFLGTFGKETESLRREIPIQIESLKSPSLEKLGVGSYGKGI